jgi:hypothetical protein
LAGLVVLAFRLSPGFSVDTPAVVLPQPTAAGEGGSAGEGDESRVVSVTPETVQAVVARLSRAVSYNRTVTVESFYSGGSRVRSIGVWVSGERTRLVVSSEQSVKNVLITGDKAQIWYSDSNAVYVGQANSSAADEYQSILTYEELLLLDSADISEAGYEEYGGEDCIYVRYTRGAFGYDCRCWISVSTGLLMGSEVYDGDSLIYRMSSSKPDISTPDESVFAAP